MKIKIYLYITGLQVHRHNMIRRPNQKHDLLLL